MGAIDDLQKWLEEGQGGDPSKRRTVEIHVVTCLGNPFLVELRLSKQLRDPSVMALEFGCAESLTDDGYDPATVVVANPTIEVEEDGCDEHENLKVRPGLSETIAAALYRFKCLYGH